MGSAYKYRFVSYVQERGRKPRKNLVQKSGNWPVFIVGSGVIRQGAGYFYTPYT